MPQETALKYSDVDKDGKVDDDFEKKIRLAEMMLQEDRWAVEKDERATQLQMAQQEAQRKAQEQQQLQQMISDSTDMLGQVTIEKDGPLQ
jgi:hypothetical protein